MNRTGFHEKPEYLGHFNGLGTFEFNLDSKCIRHFEEEPIKF